MGTDSTDHEIVATLRKMHCFNSVLRQGPRIQPPVYSVIRAVNKQRKSRIGQGRIDGASLSPIIIDEDMVEPADNKVYRSTCLDCDFVRCQLVLVTGYR